MDGGYIQSNSKFGVFFSRVRLTAVFLFVFLRCIAEVFSITRAYVRIAAQRKKESRAQPGQGGGGEAERHASKGIKQEILKLAWFQLYRFSSRTQCSEASPRKKEVSILEDLFHHRQKMP